MGLFKRSGWNHCTTHTVAIEEFNIAVFLTNQVVSDPGGGAMFTADPKKVHTWVGGTPALDYR